MKRTVLRVEELEQRDVPSTLEVAPALLTPHFENIKATMAAAVTSPAVTASADRITLSADAIIPKSAPQEGIRAFALSADVIIPKSVHQDGVKATNAARLLSVDAIIPKSVDVGQPTALATHSHGTDVKLTNITDVKVTNLDRLFIAVSDPAHGVTMSAAVTMPALGAPAYRVA